MSIGSITHLCGFCGEQRQNVHFCPKQNLPMTMAEFFAEAKRLNLRMLGTPEETRAAFDLKDAEIERLRDLTDSTDTRAVNYMRRARKAEKLLREVLDALPGLQAVNCLGMDLYQRVGAAVREAQ